MYFARLRDSLREDYESFAKLVGDEAFELIVAQYLVQHPSDNPSLRYHGRHFPEFLRVHHERLERLVGALRPDLADLCALEWARIEVFDAPEVELLRPATLAQLAEQDWPDLKLELIPAQRLLEGDYRLEQLWAACARDEAAPASERSPGTLLVWRRGFAAFHRAVPHDEARALRLLRSPLRFADLCQSLAEGRDLERAVERTLQLLRQWLVDELLAAPTIQAMT
jgi:Putative DNA-binding domain